MPTNYCRGVLKINDPNGFGWLEEYNYNTPDIEVARRALRVCANYRAVILAYGWRIVAASVVNSLVPRRSRLPASYQTQGQLLGAEGVMATDALQNNPQAQLMYRFQTASGRYVVRGFRGIRDSWITGVGFEAGVSPWGALDPIPGLVPAFPGLTTGWATTPAQPAAGAAYTVALNAFLTIFGQYTCLVDTVGQPAGTPILRPFTEIYFDKVGSRDTGPGVSFGKARRKKKI